MSALSTYYKKKGLAVIVIRRRDRFLEAEIYRDKAAVDRILFDLRTGRIRSIYIDRKRK